MKSPKDMEYMQELEYIKQIESFQYQIACVEKEIAVLKLAHETQQKQQAALVYDYPSPVSLSSQTSSVDLAPVLHHRQPQQQQQQQQQQRPELLDFLTQEDRDHFKKHVGKTTTTTPEHCTLVATHKAQQPSWEMTLKDGQFTINTHILSHAQLYATISHMPAMDRPQANRRRLPVPLESMRMAQEGAIGTTFSIMIWRKYMKARFRSLTSFNAIKFPKADDNRDLACVVVPVEGLTAITVRLIGSFFQCRHFLMLGLYVPAFIEGYMQGDILQSPAAMALCSVICNSYCRHLLAILPKDALREYGAYYFEQARQLIEDRFDTVDMETMMTLTWMSIYQFKWHDFKAATTYISMAERMFDVLKPRYGKDDVLFLRFHRCIYQCRSLLTLQETMDNCERPRIPHNQLMELLDWNNHIPVAEGPDDTEKERQFIRMQKYIAQLRKVIDDGGKYAVAPDYPTFVSVFGHHVEMGMRHWYRSVLPQEFQLSLPLFDDHVDDLKFFTVLESECGDSPVKLITLINVYNEYLVMAKSYLPHHHPKTPLETEELVRKFKEFQYTTSADDLKQEIKKETDEKTYHWLRIVTKMRHLRQHNREHFTEEELEEPDEDYFVRFIRALNPSNLTFDMPISHTSVKTALNTVRLSQFLSTRDHACFLDVRWILNAWEILIRAVRFKYQQPEDTGLTLDRIRANLVLCLQMLRDFVDYSFRSDQQIAFLEELQEELNSSFM